MPAKQTMRWPKRRVARSLRPPGPQQSRLIPFQAGSDQAAATLRPVDQAGRFPESLTFLRQGSSPNLLCHPERGKRHHAAFRRGICSSLALK